MHSVVHIADIVYDEHDARAVGYESDTKYNTDTDDCGACARKMEKG